MKKNNYPLLAALLLMFIFQFNLSAQTLVWSDEFDGTSVNTSNWAFETGGSGFGNNELQYYRPENSTVSGGLLTITAKREAFGGRNYTSSRLSSAGKRTFKYGRMESRLSIPSGSGLWPAFWMLGTNIGSVGWPSCGEIDIMEHINAETRVYGTIHWQSDNGYANYGGNVTTTPTNFHVYAVDWNASEIRWFIDGAQFHVVNILNGINSTQEFHNPFFFILNLAVGGNWPGFTIDETKLPARYVIDYVRAYQTGVQPGIPFNQTIYLRGNNNQYVSSENGTAPIRCNRTSVQAWEKFVVIDAGSGKVALRASNGRYVSSGNGTTAMTCNSATIGTFERFDWVGQSAGNIALRGNNGQYVSSENGTAPMNCNRAAIGAWEVFAYATTTPARLGADEVISLKGGVDVYPNMIANGDRVNINLKDYSNASPVVVNLLDINGKVLVRKVVNEKSTTIQTEGLQKGIYHLQISNGAIKEIKKVIVK